MAITTAMCTSFKQELLQGVHSLESDDIKVALIKESPSGTYDSTTTNYSDVTGNSDEAVGSGYPAGGQTLDNISVTLDGATAVVDIDDETFANITVSSDGCIIYNASASNEAIAVIDFGGTKASSNGDFTLVFPTADSSTAIIRVV